MISYTESSATRDQIAAYAEAISHLRDTTKWLVTILAAVAAVLLAGVQFSSIGKLTSESSRTNPAIISGIIAVLAVALIIAFALNVMKAGRMDSKILERDADKLGLNEYVYLNNEPNVKSFLDAYQQVQTEQYQARLTPANVSAKADTDIKAQEMSDTMNLLLQIGRYEAIRQAFEKASRYMIICGVVGAIAIMFFLWAINPPATNAVPETSMEAVTPTEAVMPTEAVTPIETAMETTQVEYRVPSAAYLTLTPYSQKLFASVLGNSCVAKPIAVVVTAVSDGVYNVMTVPGEGCTLAHFPVAKSTGQLTTVNLVELK
jgi:hypothetical protein